MECQRLSAKRGDVTQVSQQGLVSFGLLLCLLLLGRQSTHGFTGRVRERHCTHSQPVNGFGRTTGAAQQLLI